MDDIKAVSAGTKGSIEYIDGIGQLCMKWDNKRTLVVNLDVDNVRKI